MANAVASRWSTRYCRQSESLRRGGKGEFYEALTGEAVKKGAEAWSAVAAATDQRTRLRHLPG